MDSPSLLKIKQKWLDGQLTEEKAIRLAGALIASRCYAHLDYSDVEEFISEVIGMPSEPEIGVEYDG